MPIPRELSPLGPPEGWELPELLRRLPRLLEAPLLVSMPLAPLSMATARSCSADSPLLWSEPLLSEPPFLLYAACSRALLMSIASQTSAMRALLTEMRYLPP